MATTTRSAEPAINQKIFLPPLGAGAIARKCELLALEGVGLSLLPCA